jgi:drug/metabolite transporter (DMT)-like permease
MNLLFLNLGTQEMMILFIFFVIGLAPLLLAIWALVDIFKRDFAQKSTDRLLLIILVIFAPFIGSVIYFLALKKNYPLKDRRQFSAIKENKVS